LFFNHERLRDKEIKRLGEKQWSVSISQSLNLSISFSLYLSIST
jgi:hypothetical protein